MTDDGLYGSDSDETGPQRLFTSPASWTSRARRPGERTVAGTMDGQGGEFCLDVSALSFMDSTGARALLHVHNRVESVGRRLVILSPTRPVWRGSEVGRRTTCRVVAGGLSRNTSPSTDLGVNPVRIA